MTINSIVSVNYQKITNRLSISISVANYYTKAARVYNAIWDTGAMCSVITPKVFNELQLSQLSTIKVNGVNSANIAPVACVDFILPKMNFPKCYVTVCNINTDADILLGMDIIKQGDFLITNDDETVLSFTMPSIKGLKTLENC